MVMKKLMTEWRNFLQEEMKVVIGAVKDYICPPATQDLELNTKNRDAAIKADHIKYGPLNVDEPGDYWKDIAKYWDTTEEAAKKSNCGNCVAFDISPRMKDCMPGETSDDDGELGYCWMHHFKCHSARSCYTWAKGGPIDEDSVSYEWQDKKRIRRQVMKKLMTEWRNFQKVHKVNEKIYKQYASRLSEDSQEVFWNLSEDQKVFVVEDWISQGRPAQHLTEEKMADLDAEQAYSTKVRGVNVIINLKDTDVQATKHSKERQYRHDEKISNKAIIQAVEMAIGKIIQDYANGELGNDEPFHIRMVGKGKVPALNVIAVLDMRKGPDTIKVITVMRKDDFKTDTFGGGEQKTYTVQTR
jgi:hypothetical protein